ncbi:glycoside hydrolase family 35 protein [Streptomyces mexicanus]|uniref:glycoside hydrolase family 35 protein n=1 Tax=Streptomyces mexicanus TaxID=178566 RepID=UPI0031E5391E
MALSRRTFSALAGTAALGLALGGSGGSGASSAYAARESPAGPPPPVPAADGRRHTVGFDRYSLLVDGRRLPLWSGEVHPFRLPSPSLWRDVLQKMRAHGHNAVSVQVAWNHHSPAPGRYDFTGVRDLGLFLRTAAECGLYVVLRPGPYIGADTDAGGFPGWLTATAGTARTADPAYLRHVDEWLTHVNAIAARHLFTKGTGTVLLYQIENGYDARGGGDADAPARRAYMSHLYAKVRADGIDVPLFHNDRARDGSWMPGSFDTGGDKGRWLYGFDAYPAPDRVPSGRGRLDRGGKGTGSGAARALPGFMPEAGGGWRDAWGGAGFHGKGYAEVRRTRDAAYLRRFHLTNLADGITMTNVYMAFGGTSWGWLPAPQVYTSYDYGAAFDEARQATDKLAPLHQIGHMLQRVPGLAKLEPAGDARAGGLTVRRLRNPDTGTEVRVLRNDGGTQVSTTLAVAGDEVPVTVAAKDAWLMVGDLPLGRRRLRYATAQPLLVLSAGRQDVAVFCGRRGAMARVVLEAAEEPLVTRLSQQAAYVWDRGLLRVTAPLGAGGLIGVRVEGGDTDRPLLILLADDATSLRLWPYDTPAGSLVVYGPKLLRTAEVRGSTLHLTGDTVEATDLEVWGPRGVEGLTWNGRAVPTRVTGSGSLRAVAPLPGVPEVRLPELGGWRMRTENPESAPGFDDSSWRPADKTSSFSTTAVPEGQPVLFADDYGFHYGDVWYRGTFDDATGVESVSLAYSAGTQGLLMAWLDGAPLGTHRMPVPDAHTLGTGTWQATATFPVRARHLAATGPHVLSVLVRPMGHDQDGGVRDAHKAARGLTSVTFAGAAPAVRWRVQGAAAPDPVRGPLNNGGLYGERHGWHLPGFADGDWERVDLPRAAWRQGVAWYRTTFRLDVDPGVDASIGLTLDDAPDRAWRAQIFLNGWNMGQYVNDVGPQHTFVLPNGILRTRGANTLALAVLSGADTPSGPGRVRLTLLGSAAGGVRVRPVDSPGR